MTYAGEPLANALWLLLALPKWYASAALRPFSAGLLTEVPGSGLFALAVGAVASIAHPHKRLWWFLASVGASELLVTIAGALRGNLRGTSASPILMGFVALQLALFGLLIWRCRGSRLAAVALSAFCLTYSLEAGFVAGMAFNDDWL